MKTFFLSLSFILTSLSIAFSSNIQGSWLHTHSENEQGKVLSNELNYESEFRHEYLLVFSGNSCKAEYRKFKNQGNKLLSTETESFGRFFSSGNKLYSKHKNGFGTFYFKISGNVLRLIDPSPEVAIEVFHRN